MLIVKIKAFAAVVAYKARIEENFQKIATDRFKALFILNYTSNTYKQLAHLIQYSPFQ